MAERKYRVKLTEDERVYLIVVGHKGNSSARKVKRALLKADEGISDPKISEPLSISVPTVGRLRKRFVVEGMERALNESPRRGRTPKLSGKREARLVAVTCSDTPEGYTHWTLRLLAGKVVELGSSESVSPETVRQILKKRTEAMEKKEWRIPEVSGEFVARMEDVLDLYNEEYAHGRPVVRFDETSKQLIGHTRVPIATSSGHL